MSQEKEHGFQLASAALQDLEPEQAFSAAAEAGHPEIAQDIRERHALSDYLCSICGQARHHMAPRTFPYKGRELRVCNSCASMRLDYTRGEWLYFKHPRKIPK